MRVATLVALVASAQAFNYAEHLSTKGPYGINSTTADRAKLDDCDLQQIQLFIRHGTRYPSFGDILAFDELTALLNTTHPFLHSQAGLLAPQGELEMYRIGKRIQSKYPNVLQTPSYLQSSDVQRTSQSLSALTMGLYEGQGHITSAHLQPVSIVRAEPRYLDRLISMKYACPLYTAIQERDEKTRSELALYIRNRIEPIRKRLSKKLGLEMTSRMADSIYRLCAFYTSHHVKGYDWCGLLTKDDFLALEFFNDIEDYYQHAYGHEINTEMGCALLQNIKHSMQEPTEHIRIFLGHAEGMMLLLTHLGVMKDTATIYRGNASDDDILRHQFRTSNVSFSANVGFELWQCKDARRVRVIINEDKVITDSTLEEFLGDKNNTCDWDDLCHVDMSTDEQEQMTFQIPL